MNKLMAAACLSAAALLAACSGEAPERTVFEDQTDAIDKARDVNALIEDTAAAQRRAIDEHSE